MSTIPMLLPIIVGISIILIVLFYWTGGRVSVKGEAGTTGFKNDPYACGEDFPAKELKIDLENFFVFAIYLLVFDVLVFLIGTGAFSLGLGPLIYLGIVLAASAMLVAYREVL